MRIPRVLLGLAAAVPAMAASSEPLSLLGISTGKDGASLSVPMQIVIMLTLMTLLPAAVMSITPFLRIVIVLHFLRQALGTQSTPSNQVLLGLALFLAIVIMQPVVADMYHQGWEPMENGQMTATQAMEAGSKPLHNFLVKFARDEPTVEQLRELHESALRFVDETSYFQPRSEAVPAPAEPSSGSKPPPLPPETVAKGDGLEQQTTSDNERLNSYATTGPQKTAA